MARNVHNVPVHVLDAFHNLIKHNNERQIETSISILKYAAEIYSKKDSMDVVPSESKEIQYILNRLVGCLYSSHNKSRQGGMITLHSLLTLYPNLIRSVIDAGEKRKQSCSTKNEERDQMIGELLTYEAIVRSSSVYKDKRICAQVITKLFELSAHKSYTKSIGTQALVDLINNDPSGYACNEVLLLLNKNKSLVFENCDVNEVWLRLSLLKKEELLENQPEWLAETLSSQNYSKMTQILLKSVDATQSTIHPVIESFISSINEVTHKKKKSRPLMKFWNTAIVPLLASNLTTTKTYFIIAVSALIIPHLKEIEEVEVVLGEQLISIVMKEFQGANSVFRSHLINLCKGIVSLVEKDKEMNCGIQTFVLKKLIVSPGNIKFDKLTGTKTLQQCIEHLSKKNVNIFSDILSNLIQSNDEKLGKKDRILACQLLSKLPLFIRSSESHLELKKNILITLMVPAFFTPNQPITLLHAFREGFSKSLDDSCAKLDKYAELMYLVLQDTDTIFKSHQNDMKDYAEISESWDHVLEKVKKIYSSKQSEKSKLPAAANDVFIVLYSHMAYTLFIERENASEIISELDECLKNAKSNSKRKSKSSLNENESPYWVDIIVDLLLSLLSKTTHNWQRAVFKVFKNLSPMLSPTSISTITSVLEPENTDEVMQDEDLDDEDDEEDMDLDETTNEEDKQNGGENEETKEEDDESEEEGVDSDEEDDGLPEDKLIEMKSKLMPLIGPIGDDDIEIDTVPEDELKNLDKQLAGLMAPFIKAEKKKKTELAKNETELMHFRTRVCSLLEVLLDEAPSIPLILQLINPLIISYQHYSKNKLQEPLANRLKSVLNKLIHIRSFKTKEGITEAELVQYMDKLYEETETLGEFITDTVGGCCSLIMRCGSISLEEKAHTKKHLLIENYNKHLQNLLVRKKDIQLKLKAYSAPFNLDYGGLWSSAFLLSDHAFNPKTRLFRRYQALEVLKIFYHNNLLLKRGSSEDQNNLFSNIISNSITVISNIKESKEVKVQFMSTLFELLKIMKHTSGDNANWNNLKESLIAFRTRITVRDIKAIKESLNRLCNALNININITKKNKQTKENVEMSDDEKEDEQDSKERKKEEKKQKVTEQLENEEKNKKKKNKRMWMETKKKQLGSQTIDELENFNFADEAVVNVANSFVDEYKPKTSKKFKKK